MSFAAVQKHVAVLERAGLLNKRRSGREQLASGDVEAVRSVASMLDELESVWRGRVARIDALLTQGELTCPSPTSPRTSTNRTLAITAEFAAPVERVWALYADPRQLEQVWGPPDLPGDLRRPRPAPRRPVDLLHDLPRGREVRGLLGHHGGRRAAPASPSTTASPTRTSTPNPDLPVSRNDYVFERHRGRHARRSSRAPSTPPRPCRRCSTWASRRAPRSAINQIDGFLADSTQNA